MTRQLRPGTACTRILTLSVLLLHFYRPSLGSGVNDDRAAGALAERTSERRVAFDEKSEHDDDIQRSRGSFERVPESLAPTKSTLAPESAADDSRSRRVDAEPVALTRKKRAVLDDAGKRRSAAKASRDNAEADKGNGNPSVFAAEPEGAIRGGDTEFGDAGEYREGYFEDGESSHGGDSFADREDDLRTKGVAKREAAREEEEEYEESDDPGAAANVLRASGGVEKSVDGGAPSRSEIFERSEPRVKREEKGEKLAEASKGSRIISKRRTERRGATGERVDVNFDGKSRKGDFAPAEGAEKSHSGVRDDSKSVNEDDASERDRGDKVAFPSESTSSEERAKNSESKVVGDGKIIKDVEAPAASSSDDSKAGPSSDNDDTVSGVDDEGTDARRDSSFDDDDDERRVERQIQEKIDSIKEELKREIEQRRRIGEIEENNAKYDEMRSSEEEEEEGEERSGLSKRSNAGPSRKQVTRRRRRRKRRTRSERSANDGNSANIRDRLNEIERVEELDPRVYERARLTHESIRKRSAPIYGAVDDVEEDDAGASGAAAKKRGAVGREERGRPVIVPERACVEIEDELPSDLTLDSKLRLDASSSEKVASPEAEEESDGRSGEDGEPDSAASLIGSSRETSPRLATEYQEAFGGLRGGRSGALARFKRIKRVLRVS